MTPDPESLSKNPRTGVQVPVGDQGMVGGRLFPGQRIGVNAAVLDSEIRSFWHSSSNSRTFLPQQRLSSVHALFSLPRASCSFLGHLLGRPHEPLLGLAELGSEVIDFGLLLGDRHLALPKRGGDHPTFLEGHLGISCALREASQRDRQCWRVSFVLPAAMAWSWLLWASLIAMPTQLGDLQPPPQDRTPVAGPGRR